MTHDELLIEINRRLDVSYYNGDPQSMQALRAVVELHKPEPIPIPCPDGKPGCCVLHYANRSRCTCGAYNYPCPTIQAIEKELK